MELFYLTTKCVAQVAMKSGEGRKRGNPVVRSEPCPGEVRRGPVPADGLQEMRDTDFQMGLRREN